MTVRDAIVDLYISNVTAIVEASKRGGVPMRIDVRALGTLPGPGVSDALSRVMVTNR